MQSLTKMEPLTGPITKFVFLQLSTMIYPPGIIRISFPGEESAYLGGRVEEVHCAICEVPDLEVEPVDLAGELDEVVVAGLVPEHVVLAIELLLGCYACHF